MDKPSLWRRLKFSSILWNLKSEHDSRTPDEKAHDKHLRKNIHDCNCWMCEAEIEWKVKLTRKQMKELKRLTDKVPFTRVNWWLQIRSGRFTVRDGKIELEQKNPEVEQ